MAAILGKVFSIRFHSNRSFSKNLPYRVLSPPPQAFPYLVMHTLDTSIQCPVATRHRYYGLLATTDLNGYPSLDFQTDPGNAFIAIGKAAVTDRHHSPSLVGTDDMTILRESPLLG